jgi:hypothetical protein
MKYFSVIGTPSDPCLVKTYIFEVRRYYLNWTNKIVSILCLTGKIELCAEDGYRGVMEPGDVAIINPYRCFSSMALSESSHIQFVIIETSVFGEVWENSKAISFKIHSKDEIDGAGLGRKLRALMAELMLSGGVRGICAPWALPISCRPISLNASIR